MPKVDILGVKVDAIDMAGLHDAITGYIRNDERAVVAYANVHAINIAQKDEGFKALLNDAAIVYCDGEGLRIGARLLGSTLPPRVALTRWIGNLCHLCERNKFSVFLLGSTKEALDQAVTRMKEKSPALRIAGVHHGYFQKTGPESDSVVEQIIAVKPNVLFVGFGMPMQEEWISRNIARLQTNVILPAGSMIEYVAGVKNVAPHWMSANGMEWLFRLMQEPARLWKRYLIGNPSFLLRVLIRRLTRGKGQ